MAEQDGFTNIMLLHIGYIFQPRRSAEDVGRAPCLIGNCHAVFQDKRRLLLFVISSKLDRWINTNPGLMTTTLILFRQLFHGNVDVADCYFSLRVYEEVL
jgi:hypothetical protein